MHDDTTSVPTQTQHSSVMRRVAWTLADPVAETEAFVAFKRKVGG